MKIIRLRPNDEQEIQTTENDIYVNRMMCLFVYIDDNVDNSGYLLRFCFIADTCTKDKFITIIFNITSDGKNDEVFNKLLNIVKDSGILSINMNPHSINLLHMFYNNEIADNIYNTDFIIDKTNDHQYPYSFYARAFNSENKSGEFVKLFISDQLVIGLGLFLKSISSLYMNENLVSEMNQWLLNEKKDVIYNTVNDFTVLDISRTSKIGKKQYIGIVVVELALDNLLNITVVMNYQRSKRIPRSMSSTINFLECVYNDACMILPFCGRSNVVGDDSTILIGVDKKGTKVFKISNKLFDELQKGVEKLK